MGICQTKVKNTKKKNQQEKSLNHHQLQKEFIAATESGFKRPEQSQLSCERYIGSPPSSCLMISRRRQTNSLGRKTTLQGSNSFKNIMELVNPSNVFKKYSLLKNRSQNDILQVMQNNKTGIKVEMETIQKDEPQAAEFVKWLIQSPLDHPYIIKMIEVFEDQNQYQIIYESFEGQQIQDLMKEDTKVSKMQIAQIFQQMLIIIQFLHQKNLLHGNLKLSSFRILKQNSEIKVKLFDLKGLRMKISKNQDIEILKCVSPECLYHLEKYTQERDVWAVGLIGYSLRKRSIPYKILPFMNQAQIIAMIQQHNFTFQRSKDEIYKSFLYEILAKNPRERKSCEELLNHPFIVMNKESKQVPQIQLLTNLLNAKSGCLIQQLLLCYFLQEFNWEEYILLQKIFYEGDQDMDGLLSKQELIILFNTYLPGQNDIEHLIDELFLIFEINDKGGINNLLFQTMTANRSQILIQPNIEICFSIFSQNKKEITLRGLKRHLNYDGQDLIDEFARLTDDLNKLSFLQFEKLIKLLL